jgi:MinD-like ATPase involved in chromosome partitioning or flagellar assembly
MNAPATPASRVIALSGTAGGVGTTTVAALLFSAFGQQGPRLLDRSGGELGRRLTGGDDVPELSDEVTLHDLGPHASGRALDRLDDRRNLLIVVTAATPRGIVDAESVLGVVRERFGQAGLVRTIVTPVGVFGRARVSREVGLIQEQFGRRGVVTFPRDPVLAGGGRIPANRLSVETRRAQSRLLQAVRERLRTLS